MAINSITSNNSTQSLIARTMTAADLDKNGQLSSDEFASFFTTLLDSLSGNKTPAATSSLSKTFAAAAVATTATAAATGPKAYAPVAGFDFTKLKDEAYVNAKYTPAVRVFSQGLAELGLDARSSRGNLSPLADYAKQHGFPDAKTVSDDQIDFGDGHGSIDVLTASDTWWFCNQK